MRNLSTPVAALGDGYNTFRATAMPSLLSTTPESGGHSIKANVFVCTSTKEVYEYLGVSADVSMGTPWGSFEDKIDFVKALNLNTTSVVILVFASKITSSSTAKKVSFADGNQPSSAKEIYQEGGDCYVSSIAVGGQFIGAYSFIAYDQETFEDLQNQADASFGSGDFDASFETHIQNITTITNVTSTFQQTGIGFSTGKLPTPDGLVDFVLDFGNLDLDGPTVLDFSTTSYSAVPGCPDFTCIDGYRTAFTDTQPSGASTAFADLSVLASSRLQLVKDVATLYARYNATDNHIGEVLTNLQGDLANIQAWVDEVSADPTIEGIVDPAIIGVYMGSPVPQYNFIYSGAAGGTGGGQFNDLTITQISQGVQMSAVTIRGHEWVDHISTTYVTLDPNNPEFTCEHGGDGGDNTSTIAFAYDEFVTEMDVISGDYFNSIVIKTNKQTYSEAPPAPKAGVSATWTTPADSFFVGFNGHDGQYVDSLTAVYVQFSPVVWSGATVIPNADGSTDPDPETSAILKTILAWATPDKLATIYQLFLQKGGWEGWLQCELAQAFQKKYTKNTNIFREDTVYQASAQRADIFIQHNPTAGMRNHVIELKCESLWQDGARNNAFIEALAKDINKILSSPLNPASSPASLWAIGFTCSDAIAGAAGGSPTLKYYGIKFILIATGWPLGFNLYLWYVEKKPLPASSDLTTQQLELVH